MSDEPAQESPTRRKPRPRLGRLRLAWQFLRDPSASLFTKLLFVAALVYVVMPLDAIPDVAPLGGWLDDIGIFGLSTALLGRALHRYGKAVEEHAERDQAG